MKLITRTASTLAIAATLLSATSTFAASAFAATPFDIATRAYRGQLPGIAGYQSLKQNLSSGAVSVEDILRAAGATPSRALEQDVSSFLHDSNSN